MGKEFEEEMKTKCSVCLNIIRAIDARKKLEHFVLTSHTHTHTHCTLN